jgi:hypothetical protein
MFEKNARPFFVILQEARRFITRFLTDNFAESDTLSIDDLKILRKFVLFDLKPSNFIWIWERGYNPTRTQSIGSRISTAH